MRAPRDLAAECVRRLDPVIRKQLDTARRLAWWLQQNKTLASFAVSLAQRKRQSELASRPRKSVITMDAYQKAEGIARARAAEAARAFSRKELASLLGVSLQAVRDFERRQEIEVDKPTG